MIHNPLKFRKAIDEFDRLNQKDPNREIMDGQEISKELLYAQRMTKSLLTFDPNASEALQLAARCQHLCRWEISRNEFPKGKVGYNLWRNKLKKFHAEKAGKVLRAMEYNEEMIKRVQFLVQKKQLKTDEASQILEDVICLVFLAFYFDKFAMQHSQEKVIGILRKTWKKMSKNGQLAALKLPLSKQSHLLIQKALEN